MGKTPPPIVMDMNDTKQSDDEAFAITPCSTLARSGSTVLGQTYESSRTKLCNYTKLNCLKWNYFDF